MIIFCYQSDYWGLLLESVLTITCRYSNGKKLASILACSRAVVDCEFWENYHDIHINDSSVNLAFDSKLHFYLSSAPYTTI